MKDDSGDEALVTGPAADDSSSSFQSTHVFGSGFDDFDGSQSEDGGDSDDDVSHMMVDPLTYVHQPISFHVSSPRLTFFPFFPKISAEMGEIAVFERRHEPSPQEDGPKRFHGHPRDALVRPQPHAEMHRLGWP